MNPIMPENDISQDGLVDADRNRNTFSPYRGALGAAGQREAEEPGDTQTAILGNPGDTLALTPGLNGFGEMYVGCAWNIAEISTRPFWQRLFGRNDPAGAIDLDLGCLYELHNGAKGGLQALGTGNGAFDQPPYISLSHDERTGRAEGDDEFVRINGAQWPSIRRVLIYAYIYEGAADWSRVRPQIALRIAEQPTLNLQPRLRNANLAVCALALIENVRNGLKLTNLSEYFPGQAEMDRAYGFGLRWDEGSKNP